MDFSIFDTFLDSVFVLDSKRVVVYCNEAAALLVNHRIRKILNKPIEQTVSFDFPELFGEGADIEKINSPVPFREVEFKSGENKTGKGQFTLQPWVNSTSGEKTALWILYVRDVTLEEALHSKYHAQLAAKEEYIEKLKAAQVQLENYSKNLEVMVEQRTSEVRAANRVLDAMVNSLGQGFVLFGEDGICHPTHSKACETLMETDPSGKAVWDILNLSPSLKEDFKNWYPALFLEPLPFEDLARFGPAEFKGTKNRHIKLEYHPMRDENSKVVGVVLVSTDKTDEIIANQFAERQKAYANMVVKMVKNKGQFLTFIQEARDMVKDLQREIEKWQKEVPNVEYLFRVMHTLKGCASVYSITSLQNLAHEYESELVILKEAEVSSIREKIPDLRNYIEKMSEALNSFIKENEALIGPAALRGERCVEIPVATLEDFDQKLGQARLTNLQTEFEDVFLRQTVKSLISHYDEVVGPVALRLGKQVDAIEFEGGDIRILPQRYSELFSTFVHAFRNAIDHGLEIPEKRHESGKNPVGKIKFICSKKSIRGRNFLEFVIQDDGAGIHPDKIRAKMIELGRGGQIEGQSDHDVIQHVFDAGFSTSKEVTDISGRGVGMDAIKSVAEKLGGTVEVFSEILKGARLVVLVPEKNSLEIQSAA